MYVMRHVIKTHAFPVIKIHRYLYNSTIFYYTLGVYQNEIDYIDQPHILLNMQTLFREILNLVYSIIFRRLMLYLYKYNLFLELDGRIMYISQYNNMVTRVTSYCFHAELIDLFTPIAHCANSQCPARQTDDCP